MFKSIYTKLTLAFLLIAFTTAALVGLFIRLSSADRLTQLIVDQQRSDLEQYLQNYYVSTGSWEGVAENWQESRFPELSTNGSHPPDFPREGGVTGGSTGGVIVGQAGNPFSERFVAGPDRRSLLGLADESGTVIVSVDRNYPPGSQLPANIIKAGTSVNVNGEDVGTILMANEPPGFNPQEALYLRRTSEALIFASMGALLIALIMGLLLARTLTGPLQSLTSAVQNITKGQLEQQVEVRSNDEIGQLAASFNQMSQEVARVNQQRRQMTADIAHDLRTPLTVISGYIESMRDGDLKPTPERLALIYSEIERLQDLVGDLRTLSLADTGELSLNLQPISPKYLLERATSLFRHQAEGQDVSLEVEAVDDLPAVQVDEARMMQVLGNLISNSLRHTPSGGKITLSARSTGGAVVLAVQDTGEGITADELPYIFNRFHRADKSRHTEMGETGLGLAIVKALVESHGGKVAAASAPGQGTTIELEIPASLDPEDHSGEQSA